jgi:5-formyltetrahydrofolate cyclo-ligase
MSKAAMRKAMAAYLLGLGSAELAERSRLIAEAVAATEAWAAADTVLSFLSMPHEIDTAPLIAAARAAGKTVAVPRIEGGEIVFVVVPAAADLAELPRDRWGIPVPDPAWPVLDLARAARTLVTAPGLAFDRHGNRLGRGKGYYDRFLRRARAAARSLIAVGICFSGQVVAEVPTGPGDQRVEGVATERGPLEMS